MTSRRGARLMVLAVVAPLVLGLVVGLAWWALAPTTSVVQLDDKTLVSARAPEFAAGQVGVLALLGAAAGVLSGALAAIWLPRIARAPARVSLAVVLAGAAGSAIAAGLGHALGSASVAVQRAAHPKGVLVSPLSIQTPVVLLVWPALEALTIAIVLFAAARRRDDDDDDRDDRGAGATLAAQVRCGSSTRRPAEIISGRTCSRNCTRPSS